MSNIFFCIKIYIISACPFTLCRVFFTPQNRPCTPKIVGTFYMQGYKIKEKTAIVPPVSKLSGHPEYTRLSKVAGRNQPSILRSCAAYFYNKIKISI